MNRNFARQLVLAGVSTVVFGIASASAQVATPDEPQPLDFDSAVSQFDSAFPRYAAAIQQYDEILPLIDVQENYCKALDAALQENNSRRGRAMLSAAMEQLRMLQNEASRLARIADQQGALAKEAVAFMTDWHTPDIDAQFVKLIEREAALVEKLRELTEVVWGDPSDISPYEPGNHGSDPRVDEEIRALRIELSQVRTELSSLNSQIETADAIIEKWAGFEGA